MGKGKTKLKEKWFTHDSYKDWLRQASSPYHGHCSLCKTDISVENGVEDALKKHANGKTHKGLVSKKGVNITDFFQSRSTSSESPATVTSSSNSEATTSGTSGGTSSGSQSSGAISNMLDASNKAIRAEVKYALRVVKHHSSFNSCGDLGEFLKDVFSDSPTVSKFTFGKTKCMYLIKFGIAPWIRQKLNEQVSASPFFSASFDDSHNSVLEMEQMDLQIRYWCPESNVAKTRYLGSQFQYSTTADALMEELLKGLPSSPTLMKMTQLAMDGPHTNWLVLKKMDEYREKEEMPPMDCIGSCGLHVISGALQTGVKAAEWGIEKVLMGMYKFLHKAPARRADYLKLADTSLFPHRFAPTRWVENAMVAERGIEIWDGIVKLIKFILEKTPSSRPKDNKSYENLVLHHNNPLVKVQLHLFKDVALILNRFLVTFQTDNPMVPFLSMEIAGILRSLMRLFIPKCIMKKVKTTYDIQQMDVEKRENVVSVHEVKLTTAAAAELAKVPNNLHDGLKKSFMKMLQTMIKKIQERSPLKYKLVREAACFNPVTLATVNPEALQKMFDGVVSTMFKKKRISSVDADKAKEQFDKFVSNEVTINSSEFKNFNFKESRLDKFLKPYTLNGEKYPEMWKVCIFIFTLTHGQSSVERGFNVNKDTLNYNLESSTLEALRMVYDELIAQGNDITSFEITKELLLSCKLASKRYRDDLEKKKENDDQTETSKKRKLLNDELLTVKKRKLDEEVLVKKLSHDSDKFVEEAAKDGITVEEMRLLVVKAQSLKESAKGKEKLISELTDTMEKIGKELKSLK